MNIQKTFGLMAAPFTPMKADGSINPDVIPDYYRYLKDQKVVGAFICGSTGEGFSLAMQEKKEIARGWSDCTKEDADFKVFLFVGGVCIADCIELAVYAKELDLYAVSFTSPFYFKPNKLADLVDCCKQVASSVPELPFYYYHIPSLTGVNFSMIDLLRIVDKSIPNFAGIKYTYEDLKDFLTCLQFENMKYDILWGRDANLLPALAVGAKGAVGSTYNYMATVYYELIRSYNHKDLESAQQLQQKTIEMSTLLERFGSSIPARKAYMKIAGIDCGGVRLPLTNIGIQNFEMMLEEAGKRDLVNTFSKPSN